MNMEATELDFKWLFEIAKAHGFSLRDIKQIAHVELGKPLNEFTKEEIQDFGLRLCPEVFDIGHIHPIGNA
jgi:hypothetical protein